MRTAGSTWVVFDYGGVLCTDQPDEDVVALAAAAGVGVPDFRDAYWAHRLSYDRAELDGATYWHKVAAALGRSFPARQLAGTCPRQDHIGRLRRRSAWGV